MTSRESSFIEILSQTLFVEIFSQTLTLYRSQAPVVPSLLKTVITGRGVGDPVRQHVVKHLAVSRKDSMFLFPPFIGMGKECEPIALQPSQFCFRNDCVSLKFRKSERIERERVACRRPQLVDHFIDTCFFRGCACVLHVVHCPEPLETQV